MTKLNKNKRVQVNMSILEEAYDFIRSKQKESNFATLTQFVANILDDWRIRGSPDIPSFRKNQYQRRVYINCYVEQETAVKMYEKSLYFGVSKSRVPSKIVEKWYISNFNKT